MIYTLLLLSLFLLFIPFGFALDRANFSLSMVKTALLPAFFVTIVYSEVAVFFTLQQFWVFNKAYVMGTYYRSLPLEAYLFVFALTYCCLAIYHYLNEKYPNNELQKFSLALSNLILGIFVAAVFFAYTKWFSVITVSLLILLLVGIEYISSLRFMYQFYRAFLVSLIPFYISFGIICNLPIITYNKEQTLGAQLFNIPFENHFYFMGMLLLGVYLSAYFKDKIAKR